MNSRMKTMSCLARFALSVLGAIVAVTPATAQNQSGPIRGQIVLPSGLPAPARIMVKLSGYRVTDITTYTDHEGRFSFQRVSDGTYSVDVAGDSTYHPVSQEVRILYGNSSPVLITMRPRAAAPTPPASLVSAGDIDAQVPEPAKKEFDRGKELSDKGKFEEAAESFKKAVAIYPNYLLARNSLGAQYLKMGKWSNAAEQFEAAIKINGRAFSPRLNLAIARCEEKKYTEALMSLNEALAIDNTSAAAHFYAGIASLGTDQLEQAQRELTTALSLGGDKFPLAHFFLGLVHMKNGATAQAKLALTSYLEKEPNGDKAQRARQLLDRLNK